MKLLKRILATALAIALLAFVPGFQSATAHAEGPVTYTVKYVPELNEWRVQKLAVWDETRENGAMNYLYYSVKDGDSVVVIGGPGTPANEDPLKIDVQLANLTIYEVVGGIIVYANKGITDIYVLKGSAASLHGTYDNVYVYDNSSANVNSNVKYLQISKESSMEMNVTAVGTVDKCQIDDRGNVLKTMYNVKADSLRVVKGVDKTDPSAYATAPGAAPASSTPSNPAPANTNNGGAISPKTGESSYAIWLLFGAAICFAGAFATKKKFS